jgi:hypothetical protein
MNNISFFDENESLALIKKEIIKLMKLFGDIKKIDTNDERSLEKLEKCLQKFPVSSELITQIEVIRSNLDNHIRESKRLRVKNFNSIFNEYLNHLQKSQRTYRLIDKNTLRIEMLELKTDPNRASIRFLFNKKELMPWKNVINTDDIVRYEGECCKMLINIEIPEKEIVDIFYRAYLNALRTKRGEKSTNSSFIQIKELYEEVQIELFRQKLSLKNLGSSKTITISFPMWAFLYNLDCYRKMHNISDKNRLFFETGSQIETKKNGVVLNGLDPKSDYKMFCYVRGSGGY